MHEYDYDDGPSDLPGMPPAVAADDSADASDDERGPLDAVDVDDVYDIENEEEVPDEPEDRKKYKFALHDGEFSLSKQKKTPGIHMKWKILEGPSKGEFLETSKWLPKKGDESTPTASGKETKKDWKVRELQRFFVGIGFPMRDFPESRSQKRKGKRMGFAEAFEFWLKAVKRADGVVFEGTCRVEGDDFKRYRVERPKVVSPKGWSPSTEG